MAALRRTTRRMQWALLFAAALFSLRVALAESPLDSLTLPSTFTADTPYKGLPFSDSLLQLVLRTQRDLAYNTSIDRILWPAIDLSTAYFNNNNFSTSMINNTPSLLVMGYRRLVVDLYWDGSRGAWQLCPVQYPVASSEPNTTSPTNISSFSSLSSTYKSLITTTTAFTTTTQALAKRAVSNIFVDSDSSDSDIIISNITCPRDAYLRSFFNLLSNYLDLISRTQDASMTDLLFLVLNLHDFGHYNLTSVNTSSVPLYQTESSVSSLSSVLFDIFENNIYTPTNLTADRADLANSFNTTGEPYFSSFENTTTNPPTLYTTTGWPNWGYLVSKDVRIIVSFGTVSMSANTTYNITTDLDIVFAPEALNTGLGMANLTVENWPDPTNCSVPVKGVVMVASGNESTAMLGNGGGASGYEVSWSWAYMGDGGASFAFEMEENLTACGYSPYLTSVAYLQPSPELDLASAVLGTIWSWDVGEPSSSGPSVTAVGNVTFNCAALQRANGRWKAQDCTVLFRVACRSAADPNEWIITESLYSYELAEEGCPSGYTFDAPRTAQQNLLLWRAVLASVGPSGNSSAITGDFFWIDLNNIADSKCWAVGKDNSCWWDSSKGENINSLIDTSAVGGLIILLIVFVFSWFKCRRMWQTRKHRARRQEVRKKIKENEFVTTPA